MTSPLPPRLPELAGMTEAGFNRVVAMIQDFDFHLGPCVPVWERSWFTSCPRCVDASVNYLEWRASLPKTRNKKQRKADAKREALHERARGAWVEAFGTPPPDMRTQLQRLQQFAADTGVPVGFEIAEAAMKGGG